MVSVEKLEVRVVERDPARGGGDSPEAATDRDRRVDAARDALDQQVVCGGEPRIASGSRASSGAAKRLNVFDTPETARRRKARAAPAFASTPTLMPGSSCCTASRTPSGIVGPGAGAVRAGDERAAQRSGEAVPSREVAEQRIVRDEREPGPDRRPGARGQRVEQRPDVGGIDRSSPVRPARSSGSMPVCSTKAAMRRSPRQPSSHPGRRALATTAQLDGFRRVHPLMMPPTRARSIIALRPMRARRLPARAATVGADGASWSPYRSWKRRNGVGAHQLRSPISVIVAGTSSVRTMVASTMTATRHPDAELLDEHQLAGGEAGEHDHQQGRGGRDDPPGAIEPDGDGEVVVAGLVVTPP